MTRNYPRYFLDYRPADYDWIVREINCNLVEMIGWRLWVLLDKVEMTSSDTPKKIKGVEPSPHQEGSTIFDN